MRMYDLIEKKKRGGHLSKEEIHTMIYEYCNGIIPDYQMAAMMMAIYFKGMDDQETMWLTLEMAESGEMVDLSAIRGIKVDKHSTGGVGDKTSLICGSIVAALGVKVAKMSGRGLAHTGGTIDKLESIPGLRTSLGRDEFFHTVNECGIAIIGQSGDIVPADKKLYALRDVTATVDSIPLIAASIMSKKLASGSDGIVLDVKTGSGAFMKDMESSVRLAEKMVSIGIQTGRKCCALVTNMDIPLGRAVGNALEVQEAVKVLMGEGDEDLKQVCLELAANMLVMAEAGPLDTCRRMVERVVKEGKALETLARMVELQGGDPSYIRCPEKFKEASVKKIWKADQSGYISLMDAEKIGKTSMILGAGRRQKEDSIDRSAGLILRKKYGDRVKAGDTLAELYTSDQKKAEEAMKILPSAFEFSENIPEKQPLIFARIDREGIHLY